MVSNIPPELCQQIAENPRQAIRLIDEATGKAYYVCDEAFLFGDDPQSELSREQLKSLIDAGFASGKVEKQEAHDRMRATIDRYRTADS